MLVSGGTDNHLILIDLRRNGINGAIAAYALEVAGIAVNKNGVPFDTNPPFYPSGIRMGTPAITTRGMKEKDMKPIAQWISNVMKELGDYHLPPVKEERSAFMKKARLELAQNKKLLAISRDVAKFCKAFPVP